MTRKSRVLLCLCALAAGIAGFLEWRTPGWWRAAAKAATTGAGGQIDEWRGIPVRSNGLDFTVSHGRHYSADARKYYYGQKWQCVEYVKRYYYDALHHAMPDVMGHAKDFFDPAIPDGALNTRRGLRQFRNNGAEAPAPDDLLVFSYGGYGHVAIVTAVSESTVDVIQQNVGTLTREQLPLTNTGGTIHLGGRHEPTAWLRLPRH